jgi:RsiW-degrading membrane proteinase PrsW (M82 family)
MISRDNLLYLVIGALAVAVAVLGYQLYEAKKEPAGLHINLGEKGLSIEGK